MYNMYIRYNSMMNLPTDTYELCLAVIYFIFIRVYSE